MGDPFGVNLGERSYPLRFGADLRSVGRAVAAKRERAGAVFAADGIGDLASVVAVRGVRGRDFSNAIRGVPARLQTGSNLA